jgi:uncharacterized protein YecE (DUF72 family)
MAELYAGTSGWAYPSWKPEFYPQKLAQSKFLQFYSAQLNAVEVNFTFRQLLKSATAEKWIAATPPEFRFSIKAHQVITHIRKLADVDEFLGRFLAAIEPIARAGRLAPVLFQLAPNFAADKKRLEDFLSLLPPSVPAAFEFRHPSWFKDEIFDLLGAKRRALCVAETEDRVTPDLATADFCYYRFRKPTYDEGERHDIAARARAHIAAGRDVFAYFKHEETPQGAFSARELLRELRSA